MYLWLLSLFVVTPNQYVGQEAFKMLHICQGHLRERTNTIKQILSCRALREQNAAARRNSRAGATRRIKQSLGTKGKLELELFAEYAHMMGMKPDEELAIQLMQSWNAVGIQQNATTIWVFILGFGEVRW